ncbi:MAG: GFA family protein [Pseudomonadota bacterium]
MDKRTGGCYCGAVTFEVSGPMREVVYCHCQQCRKQTGSFVGATRADDAQLTIQGGENLTWYAASEGAKRGFCKTCGSLLFWKRNGSDGTSIMAGSIDKPTGLTSGFHIFCADKGDYYEIADGLPQYAQAD